MRGRRALRALVVGALALSLTAGCGWFRGRGRGGEDDAPPDPSKPPPSDPLPAFEMPATAARRLQSGVRLLTTAWGDPALVHLRAEVAAGYGAEALPGVARLSAAMLMVEAGGYMPIELASALDRLGGAAEVEITADVTAVSMTVPRDRIDAASLLLSTLLISPAGHPGALEMARERLARRARVERNPWQATRRALAEALYPGMALAHPDPTASQLDALTLDDVLAFRAQRWTPDRTTVILVGSPPAEAVDSLATQLEAWSGKAPPPGPSQRPTRVEAGIHVLERPRARRARIIIGARAGPLGTPAARSAEVLAFALAEGPGSRLAAALKEAGVEVEDISGASAASRETGSLELRIVVAPGEVAAALNAAFVELDRVRQVGLRPERAAVARLAVASRFLAELQTPARMAQLLGQASLRGVGPEAWSGYPATLMELPAEDLAQSASTLLEVGRLVAVVSGDPERLSPNLKDWRPPPSRPVVPDQEQAR